VDSSGTEAGMAQSQKGLACHHACQEEENFKDSPFHQMHETLHKINMRAR
jgi:hypothetical protein